MKKIQREEKFNFFCSKELSCFNSCCRNVNIFLTPYDVLRIKQALGMSSDEFLKKHTVTLLGQEGLPLVLLKMSDDEEKSCPFVSEEGCTIYHDRPWSCRMYPLFPTSSEEEFFIEEASSCLGLKEDKQWTVSEWKNNQGINEYDVMNEPYKDITMHSYFKKGNKIDQAQTKLIYLSCYNIDHFRNHLFNTKFFNIYEVKQELIEKIRDNNEELLKFSYRWIMFNLFFEDTLRPKEQALQKILEQKRQEFKIKYGV